MLMMPSVDRAGSACPSASLRDTVPLLLAARTFENLDACEVLFSPSLATAASLLEVSASLSHSDCPSEVNVRLSRAEVGIA